VAGGKQEHQAIDAAFGDVVQALEDEFMMAGGGLAPGGEGVLGPF
jgi:hypothetical protein